MHIYFSVWLFSFSFAVPFKSMNAILIFISLQIHKMKRYWLYLLECIQQSFVMIAHPAAANIPWLHISWIYVMWRFSDLLPISCCCCCGLFSLCSSPSLLCSLFVVVTLFRSISLDISIVCLNRRALSLALPRKCLENIVVVIVYLQWICDILNEDDLQKIADKCHWICFGL